MVARYCHSKMSCRRAILFLLTLLLSLPGRGATLGPISYNRDIRPILSENCFYCHGPDPNKRKGKFRLDVREEALAKKAIVPGEPQASELVRRIFTADEDDLMPPPASHKKLTQSQKDLLKRWIAGGAKYEPHWAYLPPVKPGTPAGKSAIDFLVRQRLRELKLKPSPPADRRTLARRLYFDLIGLPPKPEEVEAFVQDESSSAYSKLVEKLLASPQFGERMALGWLDVVRFADTIGYHSDNPRNVWPYRDYVIKAFNENKPFDQFTREQLAGDLLPNSTLEQKVASAFNRLLLSTEEGGAQAKDYEARMLTDRVRAVGTVWLGQTIGCAQCHDHKFDPITQRDFYSLGAFFADIKEPIIGRREDGILVPDPTQAAELARLDAKLARAQKEYDAPRPELAGPLAQWEKDQSDAIVQDGLWQALTPSKADSASGATLAIQSDRSVLASGKNADKDAYTVTFTNVLHDIAGLRVEALPDGSLPMQGPGRAKDGNFVLTEVLARVRRSNQQTQAVAFAAARADFEQKSHAENNPYEMWSAASAIDGDAKGKAFGWAILPEVGKPHLLALELAQPLSLEPGEVLTIELQQNRAKSALGHFRLSVTTNSEVLHGSLRPPPPKEIAEVLAISGDKRDQTQKDKLLAHFKSVAPETAKLRERLASARKVRDDFEAKLPRCLVSTSDQPRTVRILPRGNFMIETGDIMKPALPHYLTAAVAPERRSPTRRGAASQPRAGSETGPPQATPASSTAADRPLNRLDLANWLVSRENPLTARVVMNRLWKQFFGIGLSKVAEDLGAQGELPPNQPLLDWLGCEFMDSGWDVKHMIRLIVTSQTYQQTSVASKELRARDPLNRELAAQGRWRLEAELVRDNTLAISGLLAPSIGGPSVKPYQPDGYWENLNFPPRTYEASQGEDQHRRGLYTWWQRSFLHPSLLAFDAPTREECAADRTRSNIPQQALVLLNDPTYVEASRAFAVRILNEGGPDDVSRLTWAWRQALSRAPRLDELQTVQTLLHKQLSEYRANPSAAQALLKIGQSAPPAQANPPELAAWSNAARVILNLHETITRN